MFNYTIDVSFSEIKMVEPCNHDYRNVSHKLKNYEKEKNFIFFSHYSD